MTVRLAVALAALAAWGSAVGARLWDLQVERHAEYGRRAEQQQLIEVEVRPARGTIYDARGRVLAQSLTVDSAFGDPPAVDDPEAFVTRLAGVPGIDREALRRGLEGDRDFVWIARKLDPPVAAELAARRIPGVHFLEESKRYYPLQDSAGPVLGFVGVDDIGLGGLEHRYDETLAGEPVKRTILRDARRGTLQSPSLSFHDARPGSDLHLTLDATLQHFAESELERSLAAHRAASGSVVLIDPASGAVLAMASKPDFDPNRFADAGEDGRRNRAVMNALEPGSTFKLVTAAAALESNLFDPADVLDCEMGAIDLAGVVVNDHAPFGLLTFREVIARSSNVGAIKVGLRVGRRSLAQAIHDFGFGRPTGVDMPGENPGLVRDVEHWPPRHTAYVSFGQGISATPLQLAAAAAAIANGGTLYRPYLVAAIADPSGGRRSTRPQAVGRPISAATARSLERLMEAVVEEGTGTAAAVPGYRVAGKTGTAQVPEPGGGYSASLHNASFVGFVPARRPRILGVVVIEGPAGGYHGGEVAAPVFAAIMRQALPYLGVPPDHRPPPRLATAAHPLPG